MFEVNIVPLIVKTEVVEGFKMVFEPVHLSHLQLADYTLFFGSGQENYFVNLNGPLKPCLG